MGLGQLSKQRRIVIANGASSANSCVSSARADVCVCTNNRGSSAHSVYAWAWRKVARAVCICANSGVASGMDSASMYTQWVSYGAESVHLLSVADCVSVNAPPEAERDPHGEKSAGSCPE